MLHLHPNPIDSQLCNFLVKVTQAQSVFRYYVAILLIHFFTEKLIERIAWKFSLIFFSSLIFILEII